MKTRKFVSENEAYTLSLTIEPRDSIQAIEQMLREEQKLRERLQNLEMRCAHLEDCNQKNKLLLKLFSERTVAHKYLPRSPGRKSSVPVFCNGSLSRNKSYRSMDFNATEEATTAEQPTLGAEQKAKPAAAVAAGQQWAGAGAAYQ